jgi:acetyltransferase-like isoleucine patch superfamily enzyme
MDVSLWSPRRKVRLGDYVQFGKGCLVQADLTIGNKVLIARDVAFIGRDDHRVDIVGKTIWDSGRGDRFETVVEDDVWIGHGAIIMAGVVIGRGSVVAAGSVVTKDVARYSIAAGVPARAVRMRFTPEQIEEHERLLGYR